MTIKLKYLPLNTPPQPGMLYRAAMNGGLVRITHVTDDIVHAESAGYHIYGSIAPPRRVVKGTYEFDGKGLRPLRNTYGSCMERIPVEIQELTA